MVFAKDAWWLEFNIPFQHKYGYIRDDFAKRRFVPCFTEKGWTGTRIVKEFPNKKWNYRSISRVLATYRHTDQGHYRPATARNAAEDP